MTNVNLKLDATILGVSSVYRMEFPHDFSLLWRFCVQICPSCPKKALLDPLGVSLCGPYDILSGKEISEPFLHCRLVDKI